MHWQQNFDRLELDNNQLLDNKVHVESRNKCILRKSTPANQVQALYAPRWHSL
jgi:hypothetical protein